MKQVGKNLNPYWASTGHPQSYLRTDFDAVKNVKEVLELFVERKSFFKILLTPG